ncbi:hypothetical protein [Streptomyces zhihengii]
MTRWHPRQCYKRGGALPPRTSTNRFGESSSAMRRQQDRIDDKRLLARYVQLAPGVIVIWDRQPHRVVELAERPIDLWGEEYEASFVTAVENWERYGKRGERPEKPTWSGRPFVFVLQLDGKPHTKPLHLIAPAHHVWDVLPEHYMICSACGELPPCRHEIAEREADEQTARAEALMDIAPGCCLGCGEVITSRQHATRFPGPNLWRPDLPENSAVFHARQECSDPRDRYREQWDARGGMKQQTSLFPDGRDAG